MCPARVFGRDDFFNKKKPLCRRNHFLTFRPFQNLSGLISAEIIDRGQAASGGAHMHATRPAVVLLLSRHEGRDLVERVDEASPRGVARDEVPLVLGRELVDDQTHPRTERERQSEVEA